MIEQIRAKLKRELPKYANPEKLAEALGLRPEAVRRVLDGGGLRGKNFDLFVRALGLEAPLPAPPDYWDGVRAAVTRVESALDQLRQEMDSASERERLRLEALASTQPEPETATADPVGSETPEPRRRKG